MSSTDLFAAVLFTLIPAVCLILGTIISFFAKPKEKLTSAIQHFSAGVVFAAVAVELIPFLGHKTNPWIIGIGFLLGVFIMLYSKQLTHKLSEKTNNKTHLPLPLITAVGIDVFIDGLLVGIALLAGESGGLLVTIALSIEVFFLGLALTVTMSDKKIKKLTQFTTTCLLAILIPLGGILATILMVYLPKNFAYGLISFGIAALLYLVTEELLTEAHEVKESPWICACFFFGFLFIMLLEI